MHAHGRMEKRFGPTSRGRSENRSGRMLRCEHTIGRTEEIRQNTEGTEAAYSLSLIHISEPTRRS
eukprot:5802863-Prymnesium_polylepis.3